MMDAASDEKIMKLLFEVEQLQRTLSQERQEHTEQLKDLHVSTGIIKVVIIIYCFFNKINTFFYFTGKVGISK